MNEHALEIIERNIRIKLETELKRSGILFRLFSRIKDDSSVKDKLKRKEYDKSDKQMQDLIGFRITTYFNDDIQPIIKICTSIFEKIDLVYDQPESDTFKPLRKNMICALPVDLKNTFNELKAKKTDEFAFVDSTFEIQFRTTLSEGWHEVDHNLRYKCSSEWDGLQTESRMLNGIYASLETSDLALKALFEDIAYHHYKNRNWEAMLRNKFRLTFKLGQLDSRLKEILDSDQKLSKKFFKSDRNQLINILLSSTILIPITFDHILFIINLHFIRNQEILAITPDLLKEEWPLTELADIKP